MSDTATEVLKKQGILKPVTNYKYAKYYIPRVLQLSFCFSEPEEAIRQGFELVSVVPAEIRKIDLQSGEGEKVLKLLQEVFGKSIPTTRPKETFLYIVVSDFAEQTIYKHRFYCLVSYGMDELDAGMFYAVSVFRE